MTGERVTDNGRPVSRFGSRDAETTMKTALFSTTVRPEDDFVINEATRHQYYSTMQAEVYGDDLLDAALNRRQARALLERDAQQRHVAWLAWALASLLLVGAAGWWLV